jgi:hypothetical protein
MEQTQASTATSEEYSEKQLYGGAIVCKMPKRFLDMSELRQVPDFQEVHHDVTTDQCFIVEILSIEEDKDTKENALAHFKTLAEDNDDQTGGKVYSHSSLDMKYLKNLG